MKTSSPLPILLFSVNEYMPLYVARSLNHAKYSPYFLGPAGQAVRFSRFCKRHFTCEQNDDDLVRQIHTLEKRYNIAAIIPIDQDATVQIARIRTRLHCAVLPLASEHQIRQLSDKWQLIPLFDSLGIPHPKTIRILAPGDLSSDLLTLPFLIKPLRLAGGQGKTMIRGVEDIENYIKKPSPFKSFPLIVQEYITGYDVDLSVVAIDGVIYGWTIQRWRKHVGLEFIDDPEVLAVGTKLIKEIRYSGVMHIDMRRADNSGILYVLECNTRFWGSIGASIGAGVDFLDMSVTLALGKRPSPAKQKHVTYIAPLRLVTEILTKPASLTHISSDSKHDLIAMFSDPIPYCVLFVKECINRIMGNVTNHTGTAI